MEVSLRIPKPELPLRTTLLYLMFGGLWILLSDQILSFYIFRDPQQAMYQMLKGWFFILVSGGLLYLILRRDLARRKRTEEALRESEKRFRLIAQHAEDMIWTMSMELQLTYVSPAVERTLGYSAQEILASTPEQFLTPESYALGLSVFREEAEKAQPQPDPNYARLLELEYRRRDGSTFWVEIKFSFFRDSNGHPTAVLGVGRDITERKRVEEEIAWLASFPERNPNPVIEIDPTGAVLYLNPAAQHKFPDLKAQGFKHPWLAGLDDVISRCQREGIRELQREIQIDDTWYSQPLYYVPEVARLRVYGTDITERKLAEQQTIQMKRLYATLSQVNQTIVRVKDYDELYRSICDVAVKFGEFSLAWIGLLDESTGDVHPVAANGLDVRQWPFQLVNIKAGPVMNGLIATAIRTSRVVTSDDLQTDDTMQSVYELFEKYGYRASAGVPFQLRDRTIGVLNLVSSEAGFFEDQAEIHLLEEMGLDISSALDRIENEVERKRAEEELQRTSHWLLASQRISATGGWAINLKTGTVWASPEARRIYGMDDCELSTSYIQTFPLPQYRPILDYALQELIHCSVPYDIEFQVARGTDGAIADLHSLAEYDADEHVVLGVIQDVTERKRAEQSLRESEERLRLSLQAANQGLYDLNVQTGDAIVNREYAQMLGYDPETFVETNAAWIERLHPDDRASVANAYSDYVGGLLPEYKVEFRQRMKDGNWKWILSLGKVIEYDAEGKPLRMLGTHTDITERKQAEEEIQSRSRQLTALLDASQSLTESLNRAEVLQKITDRAADVLRVETSAIYLVKDTNLYLGASTPPLPSELPETFRRAVLADHPHIAEALMTQQSVILPDATLATLTPAEQVVSDALGLRTIIYVPLVARKDATGILLLGTVGKPREFSSNESDVVRAFSNQAALAIANAMLYEDLSLYIKELESQIIERKRAEEQIQRQLKYLGALRMIDIAISSSFDLNVILDVVLQQVVSQLRIDASAIMLFNDQLQTTEYAASRGFRFDALRHTRLKLGEGYASQAVLTRKTIHISALMETGSKLANTLKLANEEFVDYYGVPLIAKGEVKGVLEIYQRSYLKAEEEWLEFLEALAGQAAIAIDNAQLFENLQRSNLYLEQRVVERTAELNRTNTELEHANRIKDEFLANMSHELRTPLTSILGLSESLREQRRGVLNDHQDKSLTIIESSGRHLLELINDILDLSKIEAGKFDYYPQPIAVDDICRSSLAFVKSQAAKKSITITYLRDNSISKILADPRRLKQILVNLLSNAVKFTLEHGEVILEVDADLEQDLIKLSVIDNGIGIADYDLRRLFQPFVQVNSGLNRPHEGTGLGLALVQKLTDLHGGSVQVESKPGKGSRFTVNLPCLQEEVAKLEKRESEPLPPVRERDGNTQVPTEEPAHLGIILLADDNMASILTIGEYIESHGYEVRVAHDGSEALKQADVSQPDLILMDIQMPVMNGLEAIAHLRGNVRFAETPIIALTALAMPGDRERSILAGANEYMSKPVSLKMLMKTIMKLTGSQN
jgi:PAS domain S-box-containing protein